jgi:hypothetical protein
VKHELVHRYTCEGCGAIRHSEQERDEFGPHSRRYGSRSTAETEAQCKEYTAEEKRRELERETRREMQVQSLVESCAADGIFRALMDIGGTLRYAADRMDAIADAMGVDIDFLTQGSGCGYDDVLTKCVNAAREKVTTND